MFEKDYPITYLPKREGEMEVTLCDISKAQDKIGYNPINDLEDYVSNWLVKNKSKHYD